MIRDSANNCKRDQLMEQLEVRKAIATALNDLEAGSEPTLQISQAALRLSNVDSPVVPGDGRWAMAETLRAVGMAAKWEPAVEAADGNAEAYRKASRLIAGNALRTERRGPWSSSVVEALEILAALEQFADVPRAAVALQRAPIIVPTTDLLTPPRPAARPAAQAEADVSPTVLLHFKLDDRPISWPMALQAGRLYRISATAAIDDWPGEASKIDIGWKSSVPMTILERRGLSIAPDGETGDSGYLVARAEIPSDQGVDLTPVVTIHSNSSDGQTARVVGQRSLRINTFTPSELGAGLPMVAQRIIELLAELDARIPSLPPGDRLNVLHLLDATTRFAADANEQKGLCGINESGFQSKLKQALTMDPRIGHRLKEAPKLGGGTTDLILERIVSELKVRRSPIDLERAQMFVRQPTQYASAGDCPVSVLTILDDSPKSEPPGIQSNYMGWAYPPTHGGGSALIPSMVAVIIIPIGFPLPSEWSRASIRKSSRQ